MFKELQGELACKLVNQFLPSVVIVPLSLFSPIPSLSPSFSTVFLGPSVSAVSSAGKVEWSAHARSAIRLLHVDKHVLALSPASSALPTMSFLRPSRMLPALLPASLVYHDKALKLQLSTLGQSRSSPPTTAQLHIRATVHTLSSASFPAALSLCRLRL